MTIKIKTKSEHRIAAEITDVDNAVVEVVIFPGATTSKPGAYPVIFDAEEAVGINPDDLRALLALIDEHVDLTEPARWVKGDRVLVENLPDEGVNLWQRGERDRWVLVTGGHTASDDQTISSFVDGTAPHVREGRSRATVIVQQNAKEA